MAIDSTGDIYLDTLVDYLSIHPQVLVHALVSLKDHGQGLSSNLAKRQHPSEGATKPLGSTLLEEARDIAHEWSRTVQQPPSSDGSITRTQRRTDAFLLKLRGSASQRGEVHAHTAGEGAAAAITSLAPLLAHIHQTAGGVPTKWTEAYSQCLPRALAAAAPAEGVGPSARPSYAHWAQLRVSNAAIQQLLRPLSQFVVEPLEKELMFHFSAGRPTAPVNEPQHFFNFLLEALEVKLPAKVAPFAGQAGGTFVLPLAQVMLTTTANTLFVDTYGWTWGPQTNTADTNFSVHTVNCILDFLNRTHGRVDTESLALLAAQLLYPEVVHVFLAAGAATAAAALASGPQVMWRRPLLSDAATTTHPSSQVRCFLLSTRHLLRSVEFQLRRLMNSVFAIDNSLPPLFWGHVVQPSLGAFLAATQVALPEQVQSWADLQMVSEVAAAMSAVVTAVEGWLQILLPESATRHSDAVDEVMLRHDRLIGHCCREARNFTNDMCEGTVGDPLTQFVELESFLAYSGAVECGPVWVSVAAVIKDAVGEHLAPKERNALCAFLNSMNLVKTAELIQS